MPISEDSYIRYETDASVCAGISTSTGGWSLPPFGGLNLGLNTQESPGIVAKNRSAFFASVAQSERVHFLTQTHSAIVIDADSPSFQNGTEGDALFTFEKHTLLSVTVADCGNILLYEKDKCCAAIHAGWKGAHAGIIRSTVQRLIQKGAQPEHLEAFVGPMINQVSYEVGVEFGTFFDSKYLSPYHSKLKLDLKAFVFDELTAVGIGKIRDYAFDTYSNPDKFYSYRRSSETGRMSAFICLL